MAILLLIRHGENDFVGKRLAGRLPDVHLNPKGRQQAESIAASLNHESIKAIFSSPMERTQETAEPLARSLGLPVSTDAGLMEIDFGDWQGKSISALKRLKLWQLVQNKPSQVRFPNGESFNEAQSRMVSALENINNQFGEKDRVACFSHCDTIKLAIAYFLNMPLDSFQRIVVNTASISRIQFIKGSAILLQTNQTT